MAGVLNRLLSVLLAGTLLGVAVLLPGGYSYAAEPTLRPAEIQAQDGEGSSYYNSDAKLTYTFSDGELTLTFDDGASGIELAKANTTTYITNSEHQMVSAVTEVTKLTIVGGSSITLKGLAFNGWTGLTSVDLSQSGVNSVAGNAFKGCTALESVSWPTGNDITDVSGTAFPTSGKYSLEWPESAGFLRVGANATCTVKQGDTTYTINDGTFSESGRVALSDDNKTVTVSGNIGLQNITIPTAAVAQGAVKTEITKVVLSEGVVTFAYAMQHEFDGCTALEEISFPSTFKTLTAYAFKDCSSLTSLDLSGTSIEVMDYCANMLVNSGVVTVKLPKTLTTIGDGALSGSTTLETVEFAEDGALTTIGQYAFRSAGIESITIPDTVTSIGAAAFSTCKSLKSVSLSKSVETVGNNVFESDDALTEIVVRDWCGIPDALKDKSFTPVVKPALAHDFSKYAIVDVEDVDDIMLQHKCNVCGELDPDDQPTALTEIIKTAEDSAVEEAARAACAEAKIDYNDSLSAAENAAAATAKVAGDAVAAAQAQAAKDKDAAVKAAQAQAAKDKDAAVKAAQANGIKANTMTVKAKTVKVKAGKKKTVKKSKAFAVKNAKGKVTFYKISGSDKVTITKAGKVKVKKGLKAKKKPYKVKVLVCAAGNKDYAPAYKTVTLKVRVK